MKQGKVTAEFNGKPSLTIPVKTRTPLEAFQMLRQGHPIDTMAGYYDKEGLIEDDFWMMDKTAKLHKLAELRKIGADMEIHMKSMQQEILANQIQQKNDAENKANSEAAKAPVAQQQTTQGTVS